jgi:hypothetical protein
MTYLNQKSFNSEGCNQLNLCKILGSELPDTALRYRSLQVKSVHQTDSTTEPAADLLLHTRFRDLLCQEPITVAELLADLKN